MLTPTGVREVAEKRRSLFKQAATGKRSRFRDENASLESYFERFVSSPVVAAYYALVPGISNELDHVRQQYASKSEITSIISKLQKIQDTPKELAPLFVKLQDQILTVMGLGDLRDDDFVGRSSAAVMKKYWHSQFKQYVNKGRGSSNKPLTSFLILEELLGLRLTGDKDEYDSRWASLVWRYLEEQDHYHMQVISLLDETEKELDAIYFDLHNLVSFKALVILTMWRLAHRASQNSAVPTIAQLIRKNEAEEEDHTLLYGSLMKDYPHFLTLLYHGWEGRPVQVALSYIDFDATPNSMAVRIDMREASDHRSPLSFAALFAQSGEQFTQLSYMHHMNANEAEPAEEREMRTRPTKKREAGSVNLLLKEEKALLELLEDEDEEKKSAY